MADVKPFPGYPQSDPRFYLSKDKKPGSPLIFFVHFYGGHQKVLKRHIQLVNDLGYDAFAFNLPKLQNLKFSMFSKGHFGAKHLYSRIITFFLNQIEGEKIIFAFSNPSASAIEAIFDRTLDGKKDVLGLICDSGPSSYFIRSVWNLVMQNKDQPFLLFFFIGLWSTKFHGDLRLHLRHFPPFFPILSIRGGQDRVIPESHIERAFAGNLDHIKLTTIRIPEASHLDALKRFPDTYRSALNDWLKS